MTPLLLFAQVLSNNGLFSVDFDNGCNPFEVNITPLDTFGSGAPRFYFYGDGSPETTSSNYTYSSSGTFELISIIGTGATTAKDTTIVNVYDPTQTNFSVEKCNTNGIVVTSEEQVYDSIRVYFTATDSATLALGQSASHHYSSNANQSFQTKGLYNGGRENCTLFQHNIDPVPALTTPTINTASVKESCRDFFVLELEISGYDSLIEYQIEIEQASTSIVFTGKINSAQVVVEDIPYSKTEAQYCVRISARDNCTTSIVQGQSFCVDINGLSATPFSNLYSSYTPSAVFINLDSVRSGSLEIYRKLGEEGTYELRRSVQAAHSDPIGSLAREYFYRIDYVDSCGEVLFSAETNPPLLSSRTLEENNYNISYTDPSSVFSEITSATYELGNATTVGGPVTGSSFDIALDPLNGTRQFLQASVVYQGGPTVLSNRITYKYKPIIHVPRAFTPNGDDLNDTLELFGLPTEIATTKIYTRWGQLIYTSTEPSPGWDGLISGSLAPEGVYMYEVTFEDSDGAKVTQRGTFALIKK